MANIYPSIGGNFTAREREGDHRNGDAYKKAWEAARAFYNCEDAYVGYYTRSTSYPDATCDAVVYSWGEPFICGVRRGIAFFDTTGKSGDHFLFVNNGHDSPGSSRVYILNGNGAEPNFDGTMYGWIFSAAYIIAETEVAPPAGWIKLYIPASNINGSGYTVIVFVVDCDYDIDNYKSGQHGSHLQSFSNCYLKPITDQGFIWVEGTNLAYIDGEFDKRLKEGTATGTTGKIAGHLWVEGNYLHYIDNTGAERRILGSTTGLGGKLAGQISVNYFQGGTELCYIDSSGNERSFEGTAV